MNHKNRSFLLALALLLSFSLSSCLKDEEPLFDVVGPVATITVLSASKTAPVVGEAITLSIRYYSPHVAIKELKLNETIGTGPKRMVTSKPVTDFNTENSYTDTFQYTVPAGAARSRVTLEVEAIGTNDLSGVRTIAINVP